MQGSAHTLLAPYWAAVLGKTEMRGLRELFYVALLNTLQRVNARHVAAMSKFR